MVALNKMDLPDAQEHWKRVQKFMTQRAIPVFAISAATGQGVRELLRAVADRVAELPRELPVAESVEELPVIRPVEDEDAFTLAREGQAYRLRGIKVERVIAMTNFDQPEALLRLQRVFQAMGVTSALERAGVREGDKVRIGEVELEWRN